MNSRFTNVTLPYSPSHSQTFISDSLNMEVTCDRISSTDGATSSKINTVGETEILGIATDTTSQNEDAVAGADVTSKKRESSVKSDDLPNKCSDKVVKRMASDYASLSR